ncbi:AzlD domain-containing protein [Paenibacillus sp. TRM 82003]|uniref:AzlD domain-containing protein n=1 Tax=Kineococcus sp. TRM81007 TaxID=2925831 RepID=UPI001F56C9ED|nr:AzlD domain-containing protein [Kineococcus sp. TRM81007]MCI2237240.1 AzlD domain-containing protein [Kineococcus sp. TRM81007]MCI3919422.1 AzlD domain-containing protein [Paenibacillus sp. TRM 82003]
MSHLLAVVAVAAAITWALRAAPFALLAPLRESSLLPYLAQRMPVGILVILTVFSLRHVDLLAAASVVPAAAGLVLTTLVHLWRQNMALSLIVGSGTYIGLMSTVFNL